MKIKKNVDCVVCYISLPAQKSVIMVKEVHFDNDSNLSVLDGPFKTLLLLGDQSNTQDYPTKKLMVSPNIRFIIYTCEEHIGYVPGPIYAFVKHNLGTLRPFYLVKHIQLLLDLHMYGSRIFMVL